MPLFFFFSNPDVQVLDKQLFSQYLHRRVKITAVLPPHYRGGNQRYPLLLLNDGQDLPALHLVATLRDLYQQGSIRPLLLVAIHANAERIQEYGTADEPDYAGRGAKAGAYRNFILHELLPYLHQHYRLAAGPANTFFAGFSLGGLSALDLVWQHPAVFSKAGVFSGSLWWRSRALDQGYVEATDRIMHARIRRRHYLAGQQFWLQAGTADETADRNHNGIIDAIDDTLGLIEELEKIGYYQPEAVVYHEVVGGRHDPATWGEAMPHFLRWLVPAP